MSWQPVRGTLLGLVCSGFALMSATAAFAQNPYTICIGDRCTRPDALNLDCSFAAAHPNDTDEEAAKLVCTVRNNYENYTYVRTAVRKGGRCGTTYLLVRCH